MVVTTTGHGTVQVHCVRWHPANKVADVPTDRSSSLRGSKQYAAMRSAGDAPKLDSEDQQLSFMHDLFDRSGGTLRWSMTTAK
jgi:hypothetical protein